MTHFKGNLSHKGEYIGTIEIDLAHTEDTANTVVILKRIQDALREIEYDIE